MKRWALGAAAVMIGVLGATSAWAGDGRSDYERHLREQQHQAKRYERLQDHVAHREFHRELEHREAHRRGLSPNQHERLHDRLDHAAYHDQLRLRKLEQQQLARRQAEYYRHSHSVARPNYYPHYNYPRPHNPGGIGIQGRNLSLWFGF